MRAAGLTGGYVGVVSLTIAAPIPLIHSLFPSAGGSSAAGVSLTDLLNGAAAGVLEEILLLVLPAVLLQLREQTSLDGRRTAVALWVVACVLRIPVHFYWGNWHIALIPFWMAGAVWLFRTSRSVWPLVIGHGLFNVLRDVSELGPAEFVLIGAVMLAAAVWALVLLVRARRVDDAIPMTR